MVSDGLEGKSEAVAKARLILRDILGDIQLRPEPDGSLWAGVPDAAGSAAAGRRYIWSG